MSNELTTTIDTKALDAQIANIAKAVVDEGDIDKVKDLTHLFNLNQSKKNLLRVMKLNGLLDTVSDKIIERFEKYPDNFSNADLLNYLQVTQNTIDKANKNLSLVDETPAIQLQQNNQVNVNIVDSYDKESRDRIMNFIKNVLEQQNNLPQDNSDDTQLVEIIEEEVDENE